MNEQEQAALKEKSAQMEAELKVKTDALTKAEADKNSTVAELTSLRTAKQEVEAKLVIAESKLKPDDSSQGTVEEQVEKALAAKDAKKIVELQGTAETKFKAAHSEFHPDNDPGGIKYAAFLKHKARINLTGLTTEDDILEAYDDAFLLMKKDESKVEGTNFNPYAHSSKNSSSEPKGSVNNKLSSKEARLIQDLGWTEERYLKIKTSRPHYVETMLSHIK